MKLLRFRSSDVFLPRVHKCQWYVCIMQLDALPHEGHRPPRVVKSSLKGSRSQLSLEEVALAARRNAARRHTRNKADGILRSLLHCAEKARKVSTACQVDLRQRAGLKLEKQKARAAEIDACVLAAGTRSERQHKWQEKLRHTVPSWSWSKAAAAAAPSSNSDCLYRL